MAGYTILQPRIEVTPFGSAASSFAELFGGDPGLDLYARATSDVYQDLFGEGIYVGKGIYDPVAFEHSLRGRVPENAVLSHDLFEGIHGRAALVTDVVLFEGYPDRLPQLLAASPPLGPGRLAAASLARPPGPPRGRRPSAEPAVADLALEDRRQSPTHAARPDAARLPARRLARVSRGGRRVDRHRGAGARGSPPDRGDGRPALGEPGLGPASGAPGRDAPAQARVDALAPARGLLATPRRRPRGRDRAHARPSPSPPPSPRVDVGGAGGARAGGHRIPSDRSGARC